MPWDVVSTSARPMRLEIDEVFRIRVVHGASCIGFCPTQNIKMVESDVWCVVLLRGMAGFNGKFVPSSFQVFCEVVKEQVKWIKDFTWNFGISKSPLKLIWIPSRTNGGGCSMV